MSLDLNSLEKAISIMQSIYLEAEDKTFMGQLDDITQNAIRCPRAIPDPLNHQTTFCRFARSN